jgi:hypothetical protein
LPKLQDVVDVHLRPSQRAADLQQSLDVYWGEPIVFRGIKVRTISDALLSDNQPIILDNVATGDATE